jgi:molybdate transport system substrate-binding protein
VNGSPQRTQRSAARRRFAALFRVLRGRSSLAWLVLLTVAFAGCSAPPNAGTRPSGASRHVEVAAASDLQFALPEVDAAFMAANPGVTVKTTFGASGTFFAQISNGAPYDVYLSADVSYPRRLAEEGLAVPDTLFAYAVGRLVVWTPNGSPLDVERDGIGVLADPRARKVAIANPEHAPYGRAAEAAMQSLGVWDAVRPKLVLGENVSQAAQFVESGAADVGVVALAHALSPKMRGAGKYWEVPESAHPRIEQGGVVTSRASDAEAARDYAAFVRGADGAAILARHGFRPGE